MKDIVKRLRSDRICDVVTSGEAADEIEHMRTTLSTIIKVLERQPSAVAASIIATAEYGLSSGLDTSDKIPAPNKMECRYCGHIGYAYGVPTSNGVSAPYCNKCGLNDGLTIHSSVNGESE